MNWENTFFNFSTNICIKLALDKILCYLICSNYLNIFRKFSLRSNSIICKWALMAQIIIQYCYPLLQEFCHHFKDFLKCWVNKIMCTSYAHHLLQNLQILKDFILLSFRKFVRKLDDYIKLHIPSKFMKNLSSL